MPSADQAHQRPRMSVRPSVARHGEMVILSVRGLAPYERLKVHARATATDDRIEHNVRTDGSGSIDTAIRLPDLGECSQLWVFAARTDGRPVNLVADEVLVRPSLH